jgi:lipoprotein-anchoring transpeptidase ErfK/SrfK
MYWDQAAGEWVTYDLAAFAAGGSGRNYSSIKRETITYDGPHGPNTIIVNTAERRLYLVLEGGKAMKYGIGVGRDGFRWSGTHRITRKAEWPSWSPPAVMIAREKANGRILPAYMEGGPGNPLGARALYIGSTIYRIHGTSEPWTIGQAVSSGCIRLVNDDIIDLYERVKVGAKVVVMN